MKISSPATKTRFARQRWTATTSASATSATEALYAVTTHETPSIVVSNWPYRSGRARTTIEESAKATATATATKPTSAERLRGGDVDRPRATPAAEDDDAVVPAEAEGVGECDVDLLRPRAVRDVVEVAVGIPEGLVDRRREHTVLQREHGEDCFHGACRAEGVAGCPLRRGHRERAGGAAECELEPLGLCGVTRRCRRPVRVDVPHILGFRRSVLERHSDRTRRVRAGRIGVGDMVRVGGEPVARDLCIDPRAP